MNSDHQFLNYAEKGTKRSQGEIEKEFSQFSTPKTQAKCAEKENKKPRGRELNSPSQFKPKFKENQNSK